MFDSARAKIGRARTHLDFLNKDIDRFIDSKPYTIGKELDSKGLNKRLVFCPTEPVPLDWSLVLGELMYDLRSALDHLVYDLSGGIRMTEFPIFEDKALFFQMRSNGTPTNISGLYKIRGVTNKETRRIIENLQPFRVREDMPGNDSAMYLLKEFCNIDKHRTLHLCQRELSGGHINFNPGLHKGSVRGPGVLEDHAVLAWWPVADNPEVTVKVDLTFDIAFDEGELRVMAGNPVRTVCDFLIRGTEQIVAMIETSETTIV